MVAMSVLFGILSVAVAVFALQNNTPMTVRFLGWSLQGVPLAVAILGPFAIGLLAAAIPLAYGNWRLRSRARSLEARVAMLESNLRARDAAALNVRPAPTPMPPARSA
jgi:uncharacterized integral membrane protein